MPNFSGLDLLAAIRADEQLRTFPVVMLTASDDREVKLKALELGATDFLAKPVDPQRAGPARPQRPAQSRRTAITSRAMPPTLERQVGSEPLSSKRRGER